MKDPHARWALACAAWDSHWQVMIAVQDTATGWGLFGEGLENEGYTALVQLGCTPEMIRQIECSSCACNQG